MLSNVAALGLLWIAYSAARGLTANEFSTAMTHASQVLDFQAAIGLPHEGDLQRFVIDQRHIIKAANIHYILVHFPVTLAFLFWVWHRHRDALGRIRNAIIATSALGLVIHVAFPLAPPRMLDGFIHTAELIGPNPYDLPFAGAANQIAAMPSLHVGWALLVAFGAIWIGSSAWRFLVLLHPLVTTVVVVVTGNHYVIDAAVAVALVVVTWLALSGRWIQPNGERVQFDSRSSSYWGAHASHMVLRSHPVQRPWPPIWDGGLSAAGAEDIRCLAASLRWPGQFHPRCLPG